MTADGLIVPDKLEASAGLRGPLPPYRCIRNFLTVDECNDLLEFAIANQVRFKPTTIHTGVNSEVYPQVRVSVGLSDFGSVKDRLRDHVMALIPQLISELRVNSFIPSEIEMELVAHGDGAFYKCHTDTFVGAAAKGKSRRLISAVYYFYSEPKAFSGGALRLYRFGRVESANDFIDIQPEKNTIVAFPSWVAHEVLPITCPSRRFADSRFAVNFFASETPKGFSATTISPAESET
jgi:Rps23 Pro-64 3,4-dihydroxylase Tpa1-like proline 4-hydroxylase